MEVKYCCCSNLNISNFPYPMSAKESVNSDISDLPDPDLKVILLGDSAVGKSKLIERYLMDEYNPRQVNSYVATYCILF